MDESREKQGSISVQVVGWTGIGPPLVRVFVDEALVGILKDKQATRFPIRVGQHRVQVRRDFMKSEVIDLAFKAGQSAALQCGYDRARPAQRLKIARFVGIPVCLATAVAVPALGLPFWSAYVLGGSGAVALGIIWWQSFIPAGAYLFLRRAATSATTPVSGI
jgi:hypothetical protein